MYVCKDKLKFDEMMCDLVNCNTLAIDVETDGLDPQKNKLCTIQVGTDNEIYLNHYLYMPEEFKNRLKEELSKSSKIWIIHNAKFDIKFLINEGFTPPSVYDTLLVESIIHQGKKKV